jgi:hypothetical protein
MPGENYEWEEPGTCAGAAAGQDTFLALTEQPLAPGSSSPLRDSWASQLRLNCLLRSTAPAPHMLTIPDGGQSPSGYREVNTVGVETLTFTGLNNANVNINFLRITGRGEAGHDSHSRHMGPMPCRVCNPLPPVSTALTWSCSDTHARSLHENGERPRSQNLWLQYNFDTEWSIHNLH